MNKKTSNSKEYIFGIRAIIENILAGKEIDKVLIQKGLRNPLIKELIQTARKYNIPFQNVPADKLNRVTRKNH
jgi:23S rRNA (guanosine2251-2'-O)-methyltransferase